MALKDVHSLELEEDYIIEYECDDCGAVELVDEEPTECELCGSENILNTTSHEAQDCVKCGHTFDMWEDAYINTANLNLYCLNCVDDFMG
jgi:ribosomal protein L37AE/L43A